MTRGPVSLEGAEVTPPTFFVGGWWLDGWPQRFSPHWKDRAVPLEIGARAYADLIHEAQRRWPPGLVDLEERRAR